MGNASSNMTRARSDTGPTLTTPEKKEMVETFDVVVVGCGAGGCIATKEMVDAGFKVHTIEKDKGPGGLYRHFYYDGLMTSSWTYTAFSIFPSRQHDGEKYPDSHPNHWTGPQYVNYLQHFMEHFDLLKLCDFETELTGFEINDADNTYTLRTNTGKTYLTIPWRRHLHWHDHALTAVQRPIYLHEQGYPDRRWWRVSCRHLYPSWHPWFQLPRLDQEWQARAPDASQSNSVQQVYAVDKHRC